LRLVEREVLAVITIHIGSPRIMTPPLEVWLPRLARRRVRIIDDVLGQVEASGPPQRRPASSRIRAMEYRIHSLLEASHAA